MRACLLVCVYHVHIRVYIVSVGHICDYLEVPLCVELCDVMMYAMSIYKQAIIYSSP